MPSVEEKDLKSLRRKMNAILSSGAYSLKEETHQLEKMTAQLKGAMRAVDAGLMTRGEYQEAEEQLMREKLLVRRVWRIRRKTARVLMTELEAELDELEAEEEPVFAPLKEPE